jgi:hypothetical protein
MENCAQRTAGETVKESQFFRKHKDRVSWLEIPPAGAFQMGETSCKTATRNVYYRRLQITFFAAQTALLRVLLLVVKITQPPFP